MPPKKSGQTATRADKGKSPETNPSPEDGADADHQTREDSEVESNSDIDLTFLEHLGSDDFPAHTDEEEAENVRRTKSREWFIRMVASSKIYEKSEDVPADDEEADAPEVANEEGSSRSPEEQFPGERLLRQTIALENTLQAAAERHESLRNRASGVEIPKDVSQEIQAGSSDARTSHPSHESTAPQRSSRVRSGTHDRKPKNVISNISAENIISTETRSGRTKRKRSINPPPNTQPPSHSRPPPDNVPPPGTGVPPAPINAPPLPGTASIRGTAPPSGTGIVSAPATQTRTKPRRNKRAKVARANAEREVVAGPSTFSSRPPREPFDGDRGKQLKTADPELRAALKRDHQFTSVIPIKVNPNGTLWISGISEQINKETLKYQADEEYTPMTHEVRISSEEEAIRVARLESTAENQESRLVLWTDASQSRNTYTRSGISVVYKIGTRWHTRAYQIMDLRDINQAEAIAIAMALRVAQEEMLFTDGQRSKVTIYSDSQAALGKIETPDKGRKPLWVDTDIERSLKVLMDKDAHVEFVWVPGHKGISGNVLADMVADRAARSWL